MSIQQTDAEQYRVLRDEIRNMVLSRLNPGQKQAAESGYGPVLCLAGAGSGKTTAMVYRIWHLLAFGPDYDPDAPPPEWAGAAEWEALAHFIADQGRQGGGPALSRQILALIGRQGVPMYNILAITFTNKAAREMRTRLENLLGESLGDMWVMTFHSACLRILKRERQYLEGYQGDFSIYDARDQEQVIREILRGLNVEEKEHPLRAYVSWISSQKSAMKLPPTEYAPSSRSIDHLRPLVYARYQQSLMKNNAMDFDDLLLQTVILFQRQPACLEKYREKFRYIIVDEYQDTNHIQYLLIKMLAQGHGNLCVVGDDDQSIYSFRQADIRNILDFEKDFPGAKVVKLEQNYRSTGRILEAANNLIANNRDRKEKKLWTEKKQGEKLYCYSAADEQDEARFVCSRVQMTREKGGAFSDHAVLMRTNAQSRVLEEWFITYHIPYVMIGGIRFYERKEIKDILAYLKLIANPDDQIALRRVINVPKRGIGDATVNHIIAHSMANGLRMEAALYDREGLGLSSRAEKSLEEFRVLFTDIRRMAAEEGITQLTKGILAKSGYRRMLQETDMPENRDRLDNLQEFLNKAEAYDRAAAEGGGSLADFLGEISLITDMDMVDEEQSKGAVQIMTMHMAKGLEFPQVFMVGMEERVFPHFRSVTNSEIEEERRLCYVAMTRAKEKLYMSWAQRRNQYGSYANQLPSRFLEEIPEYLKDGVQARNGRLSSGTGFSAPEWGWGDESASGDMGAYMRGKDAAPDKKAAQTAWAARANEVFQPGDKIVHKVWGPGSVVSAKGAGASLTYTVAFPEKGLRVLQADIAPIKKME